MINEKIHRKLISASVFETGNPWIDDALAGGINQENMLLVAAKTGVGKTFFGVQVAAHAARNSKHVVYFALEAERYEIERRRLYYEISKLVHTHLPIFQMPRYREWLHESLSGELESIENEAVKTIEKENEYLKVIYSHSVYTPQKFKHDVQLLLQEENKPEFIVLDHLHHLFLSGDEIEALKTTIHGIKAVKDRAEIPIMILAQLRKNDAGSNLKRSLPKLEDIRGTASLTDVATDVLMISRLNEDMKAEIPAAIKMPAYFHIAKSRTASEVTEYAGIVGFDAALGSYSNSYMLSKVRASEDPELVKIENKPSWARRAIFPSTFVPTPMAERMVKGKGPNYE